MYSSVYFMVCVLLYHVQVEGSCVSCKYKTSKAKCYDLFSGSYDDACTKAIDKTLCRKYGGGYSVYCQNGIVSASCDRFETSCSKAQSINHAYPAVLLLAFSVALVTACEY